MIESFIPCPAGWIFPLGSSASFWIPLFNMCSASFLTRLTTSHDFEKWVVCPLVLRTSPPSLTFSHSLVFEKLISAIRSPRILFCFLGYWLIGCCCSFLTSGCLHCLLFLFWFPRDHFFLSFWAAVQLGRHLLCETLCTMRLSHPQASVSQNVTVFWLIWNLSESISSSRSLELIFCRLFFGLAFGLLLEAVFRFRYIAILLNLTLK